MVFQLKFDIGRLVLVVIASLGLMHALPVSAQTQNETASFAVLPKAQLSIFSTSSRQKKRADFIVELARTPEHQRQGLMFRPTLADNAGMLFVFNKPRQARFWMRNTLIPLDMIFIKSNGEIETIVTRWDTQSDSPSLSTGNVRYVLEINAGFAQKLGIEAGHFIQLSALP